MPTKGLKLQGPSEGQEANSYTPSGVQPGTPPSQVSIASPAELKTHIPYDSARVHTYDMLENVCNGQIVESKQMPPTRRMDEVWSLHAMEYYAARKTRNKDEPRKHNGERGKTAQ